MVLRQPRPTTSATTGLDHGYLTLTFNVQEPDTKQVGWDLHELYLLPKWSSIWVILGILCAVLGAPSPVFCDRLGPLSLAVPNCFVRYRPFSVSCLHVTLPSPYMYMI